MWERERKSTNEGERKRVQTSDPPQARYVIPFLTCGPCLYCKLSLSCLASGTPPQAHYVIPISPRGPLTYVAYALLSCLTDPSPTEHGVSRAADLFLLPPSEFPSYNRPFYPIIVQSFYWTVGDMLLTVL